MRKRKLFSQEDGTTFKEDITDIKEDVKAFFEKLPIEIKRLLPIAEHFVHGVEELSELLKDGMPINEAIEKVLALTANDIDDKIYFSFKRMLEIFAENAAEFLDDLGNKNLFFEELAGNAKRDVSTNALISVTEAEQVEADTAIQVAVYALKKVA